MGRGHSLKNVAAIILHPNMAESLATDQGSNPGYAIPGIVQVCIIFVINYWFDVSAVNEDCVNWQWNIDFALFVLSA